jgi:hypothetical protein
VGRLRLGEQLRRFPQPQRPEHGNTQELLRQLTRVVLESAPDYRGAVEGNRCALERQPARGGVSVARSQGVTARV